MGIDSAFLDICIELLDADLRTNERDEVGSFSIDLDRVTFDQENGISCVPLKSFPSLVSLARVWIVFAIGWLCVAHLALR